MFCQNCRSQNPPNATFCQRCGSPNLVDAQGRPNPNAMQQPGGGPSPVGPKKSNTGRNIAIAIAILVVLGLGIGGIVAAVKIAGKITAAARTATSTASDSASTDSTASPDGVTIPGTIANNADAPFTIESCEGSVTTTTDSGGSAISHLFIKAVLKNISSKTITATRFRIEGLDAFGTAVDPASGEFAAFKDDDTATTPPGGTYTSTGTFDHAAVNIRKVTCMQRKASFDDGSSWEYAKK